MNCVVIACQFSRGKLNGLNRDVRTKGSPFEGIAFLVSLDGFGDDFLVMG